MRRLEFLVAKDPIRDKTGDMVMLSLLMSLARVSNSVTFVGLGAHPGHVEGGVILPKPEARGVDLLRRAMRSRRSLLHERFDIPEMSEAVRRSTADAIVADHSYLAEPFFAAQRDLPLYVSTVVSETLVWRATHGIVGRLQAGAIRRDELRAARAATAVATYDAEEAADYRASGVGRATWLEVTLPPRDDLPARDLSMPRLAFVGDRKWAPNAEGLRVLLGLWPRIAEGIPGAELWIIGRPAEELSLPDGVRDLGFVPDLDAALASCRGILAPIRTGGGVRVKVLESVSQGLPVVGTTEAVGSLGPLLGLDVAETDEQFVDSARQLLLDPVFAVAEGRRVDERNRSLWSEGVPHRSVETWLA